MVLWETVIGRQTHELCQMLTIQHTRVTESWPVEQPQCVQANEPPLLNTTQELSDCVRTQPLRHDQPHCQMSATPQQNALPLQSCFLPCPKGQWTGEELTTKTGMVCHDKSSCLIKYQRSQRRLTGDRHCFLNSAPFRRPKRVSALVPTPGIMTGGNPKCKWGV